MLGTGEGKVATQFPEAGATVNRGDAITVTFAGGDGEAGTEHEVSITVTTSLVDDTKRDALRLLLNTLANAVDESASHVQMTLKITLPTKAKGEVIQKAQSVTPHVSSTDI